MSNEDYITTNFLNTQISRLNKIILNTQNPGRTKNAFHLSSAYGGFALHQYTSDTYGIRDVLNSGHIPKKKLSNLINAFTLGLIYKNN
ncbi:MAG TPA: hypothetical protein VJ878_04710 [Candidatus Izemoplasmatales bacterium]|nr:hypothetical protein [Candidatus Izemoplasmatales bacterium]